MAGTGRPITGAPHPSASASRTLAPAALAIGAAAAAALFLLEPAEETAALVVAGLAAALLAAVWAVLDLERFVLLLVLPAMILPAALIEPAGAQVALADLLLVAALAAWLARASVGAGPAPWTSGNRLLVPTLLFAAVTAASLAWTVSPPDTVKSVVQIAEIVVLLTLVFASVPRSPGAVRGALTAYIAATCVLAAVTATAFATRAAAGDIGPQYLPGLHKNAIGSFLGVGLVLAYALWLDERRPGARRLLAAAAALELAGLLATVSRGSLLGAAIAVVVVSALIAPRRTLMTLALVGAGAAVFLVAIDAPARADEREPGGYASSLVRQYSFDRALDKISDRPLLGSGAGTYRDDIPELAIGLADPNNMFLLTAAELGVLGLAALVLLLGRFGGLLAAARRLPRGAAVPAAASGAAALSLLVHFQVDATWTRGSASLAFAMMGLMLAAGRTAPRPTPSAGASGSGAHPAARRPATAPAGDRPAPAARRPATALPSHGRDSPPDGSAPPRVVHVVTSDGYAGIERHVVRLARELRRLGCAAELACPRSATRLRAEAAAAGIPVHPSGRRGARGWIGSAARYLAAGPPDVIHLHDGRSALVGALLARAGAPAVVRTQHFTRPASAGRSGWRGRASVALHRALNRRMAAYIAVSESVAEAARRRGDTGGAEVVVIPPGIEPADDAAVARAAVIRERLPHPVVALVGRLEAEKRVEDLLRAVPAVLARLPACRFVIAGAGGAEGALRALAGRLGIEAAITWAGEVDGPAAVLEAAHVYATPSPAEGFGLATAEAMAAGLPVVAVAAGGSAELVEDGATGTLVPPGDAEALAGAIAALAGDRALAARMGAQARRRALERHGADRTASATLALYRRLHRAARP